LIVRVQDGAGPDPIPSLLGTNSKIAEGWKRISPGWRGADFP